MPEDDNDRRTLSEKTPLTRREVLWNLGAAAAAIPLGVGCGSDESPLDAGMPAPSNGGLPSTSGATGSGTTTGATTTGGSGTTTGGGMGAANAAAPDAGGSTGSTSGAPTTPGVDASAPTSDAGSPEAGMPGTDASMPAPDASVADAAAPTIPDTWATGGTAAMTGIDQYPDPFAGTDPTSCSPTCQMTLGPCHDDQAPEREDISEGQPGLPVRLGVRILDESCAPVADANVDIWHCDVIGRYSSETADAPSFCSGRDSEALAARWFRGHVQTDAAGVAWFNTCFPGWYGGRAIHIHLTVRRPTRQGEEYLTSQLTFDEDLIAEICGSHPDYVGNGQPDTSIARDSILPTGTTDYTFDAQRTPDGAMLASKTLIVRSSASGRLCSA